MRSWTAPYVGLPMRALTWLSCLSWAWPVSAQPLLFQHLTVEDGLSDNAITCVFEDRDGHIWIGTENGLDRYDGQRVEHFGPGGDGPHGTHITCMAQDGQGRLWVTTLGGGMSMRDPGTGRFTHFRKGDHGDVPFPSDHLNHVRVINDSLLVVGTQDHGAIWYSVEEQRATVAVLRYDERSDSLVQGTGYWCHATVPINGDRLWVATLPALRTFMTDAVDPVITDTVQLADDPGFLPTNGLWTDGRLYIGGWSPGIHRVDPASKASRRFPLDDEITCMVPWGAGMLLAGTKVNGLLLIDTAGTVVGRMRHVRGQHGSLSNDRVRCLLKDRSGNLWVGTANGLSVHAPATWRFTAVPLLGEQEPGDLVFHRIQQDADGTIRLSTSMGLMLVDPHTQRVRRVPLFLGGRELEATGLFHLGGEKAMLGTETGLYSYDPAHERILPVTEQSALHIGGGHMYQVRSAFADTIAGKATLIVGALGSGLDAFDATTGERLPDWTDHYTRPGSLMPRAVLRANDGRYWSATSGGIIRSDVAEPGASAPVLHFDRSETGDQHLPVNEATSLLIDDDTIWAGLRGAGLVAIVDERATVHAPPAHFPNSVLGIAMDRSRHIWCSTNNGLLRFDPDKAQWLHIPVNDGLRFHQLGGPIMALNDGRLALCADNHLLLFDPAAFAAPPDLPTPTLVDVSGAWGHLTGRDKPHMDIPYHSSAFNARVTALQPTSAGKLTFLYRLEGLETEGHPVRGGEPIHFAGIPVGKYRLLVRVRDAYGRDGPEHPLLTITVRGPIWQRWWFMAIAFLVVIVGMWLVARFRERQRRKLQGVRDRIARDLHDDIGSTLGSISMYSEALKRKLSDSEDASTRAVAEKIGSSSRAMIDRMSDIVWSVDPRHDEASSLVARMESFAADLLTPKGITFRIVADPALNERRLSATQRRNLFLIYKEALYNAVKYAACRTVRVDLSLAGRDLVLEVRDDGLGFDPANVDSHNGNGLANMRIRSSAIGGSTTVHSAPGQGTTIRVVIPVSEPIPGTGDGPADTGR